MSVRFNLLRNTSEGSVLLRGTPAFPLIGWAIWGFRRKEWAETLRIAIGRPFVCLQSFWVACTRVWLCQDIRSGTLFYSFPVSFVQMEYIDIFIAVKWLKFANNIIISSISSSSVFDFVSSFPWNWQSLYFLQFLVFRNSLRSTIFIYAITSTKCVTLACFAYFI